METILTQRFDNVTGNLLQQVLTYKGKSRVLFHSAKYQQGKAMRSHDSYNFINRHGGKGRKVLLINVYLWIAN